MKAKTKSGNELEEKSGLQKTDRNLTKGRACKTANRTRTMEHTCCCDNDKITAVLQYFLKNNLLKDS